MKRECREALVPFYGMHRFIPALIKGMGYKVVETPVNHRPRVAGVSKYGFGKSRMEGDLRHVRRPLAALPPSEDPRSSGELRKTGQRRREQQSTVRGIFRFSAQVGR
jgi:hypothetical protein